MSGHGLTHPAMSASISQANRVGPSSDRHRLVLTALARAQGLLHHTDCLRSAYVATGADGTNPTYTQVSCSEKGPGEQGPSEQDPGRSGQLTAGEQLASWI
jgi:hypothetical protein